MASVEHVSVYFIRTKDHLNLIKIGYTSDISKRLETLQTGSSVPLILLYEIKDLSRLQAQTVERQLHTLFQYCRCKGEWFTNSQPLRELILWLASGGNYNEGINLAYKASKKQYMKWRIGKQLRG